jgi:hypothetical protein
MPGDDPDEGQSHSLVQVRDTRCQYTSLPLGVTTVLMCGGGGRSLRSTGHDIFHNFYTGIVLIVFTRTRSLSFLSNFVLMSLCYMIRKLIPNFLRFDLPWFPIIWRLSADWPPEWPMPGDETGWIHMNGADFLAKRHRKKLLWLIINIAQTAPLSECPVVHPRHQGFGATGAQGDISNDKRSSFRRSLLY